jgi:two-component system CheB/CheR fusion protein
VNESDSTGRTPAAPSGGTADNSAAADLVSRAKLAFPVVGIGASAGGIDALRKFFAATSATSGMAFVVIQHLSPDHESLMAEILARDSPVPVHQIEDGMRVEPNNAYVIRPGHTVTLEGGQLRLGEPVEKRGHRRPVDDFFRSLAHEQHERSIAVVLSGMGTNGTAGAQAIKGAGGLCIAQDPGQAEFPGMPRSLIHAGYADQVLGAEEIPGLLLRFVQHPYLDLDPKGHARAARELERHRQQLNEIITLVRVRTGHDFAPYKPPTVLRRIQRRMGLVGVLELDAYAAYLKEHTAEAEALANDLMINVTGFFRDPEAWEALREAVVRPMVETRATDDPIRAWVTACASGEEAYSLAMLVAEETARARKKLDVKIFATDTADKSLALGRAGVFPAGIESDFTAERLERFFEKDEHSYRIRKELRDQVVFAPQDLLRDPPFSRLDLVTCRNLLIYLEPEAQRRALNLLHFALREGGYLFLGNAETLGRTEELFEVVSKRWRIYRRVGPTQHRFADMTPLRTPELRSAPGLPAPVTIARPSSTVAIQAALLEQFGPPTAVVDANERIVYFHGDAEPYLMHPSGETTQSLLEMVRPHFRPAVRSALRQAAAEQRAITVEQSAAAEDGGVVRVTAQALRLPRAPEHFRVSFERPAAEEAVPVPTHRRLRPGGDEALEEEARALRRELQMTVEAFEATNEELKASNEEVISINEELQSTNEELETGKEELQSLNEELTTVNGQLQAKVLELEALTNDLDNLLSSTDIAVVFLDPQLRVRRFTPAINDLLTLIPTDIGRPLAHLAQKFTDGDLIADAGQVLAKLVPLESEVHSHSGRWYLRRTRPYRTEDNHIGGVVITFVDISARKRAEEAIAAAQERLQVVIEQMPAAVLMVEAPAGKLLLANRQAATLFNQPFPLPFIGHNWAATHSALRGLHADGRPYEAQDWPLARTLATGEEVHDEELRFARPDGSRGTLAMSTAAIRNRAGGVVAAVAAFWDITERKRTEQALRASEERFRLLVESAHEFAIFTLDPQARIVSWNRGAERVTGFTEAEILGQSAAILFTPEDRAAGVPEAELRQASETGAARDERWHMRKDGSRFWASGAMTAARDAQGTLQGFVKIMRDQSERKATDARLQEALQSAQRLRIKAEEASRAKDAFISTLSHELRTPLNTIRLWARMLASGNVQGPGVIEGGKIIDRASIAQQQLIDDLLDVSRMATGHFRLVPRDALLSATVSAAIDAVRALAESRKIMLSAELSTEVGIVRIDPDRIQQVIWNLLANALKFTPEGGRVGVRLHRVNETVEIEVTDTGKGIRADFLPHVFDRFRQAEAGSTRQYGGLGLGLAIAKQIVELHGGTIRARSEGEGRGSTFTVYLPLERRYPAVQADDRATESPGSPALRGIEVLLVEDEPMALEATQRLLEQRGARVRAVRSAANAHEAFEIRRPDVIVADVGMPGEDGYALLTALRRTEQEQQTARVPAVAVTAFARGEDRQRALAAGFDEHLPKPVDPEQLIAVIAHLVVNSSSENRAKG